MQKLTPELIERIIGPADSDFIAEILATEATMEELLEAKAWMASGDATGRETHRQPVANVARLCRILAAREADDDRNQ
jgi:hypothetical protein